MCKQGHHGQLPRLCTLHPGGIIYIPVNINRCSRHHVVTCTQGLGSALHPGLCPWAEPGASAGGGMDGQTTLHTEPWHRNATVAQDFRDILCTALSKTEQEEEGWTVWALLASQRPCLFISGKSTFSESQVDLGGGPAAGGGLGGKTEKTQRGLLPGQIACCRYCKAMSRAA